MTNPRSLSVEVFRDRDFPDASVECAEAGISNVERVIRGIQIVRANRLIAVPSVDGGYVDMRHIRWPQFPADLNVVITEKPLLSSGEDLSRDNNWLRVAGLSLNEGLAGSVRVTVIDVTTGLSAQTVEHETGHLLGLKRRGTTHDGRGHCTVKNCTMHFKDEPYRVISKQPLGRTGILRRMQYEERRSEPKSSAEKFCDECAHQLAVNAFMLTKAKSGEYVPPELLA